MCPYNGPIFGFCQSEYCPEIFNLTAITKAIFQSMSRGVQLFKLYCGIDLGVAHFFIIITSAKLYTGGEGSKADVHFFQNAEMMDIFLAKSSFHCFFYSYAFGERGGGMQKEYVLYARENDEENC